MKVLIIAFTFTWVGLILGISFLEAPLKFQAPNITTKLGLGIGKLVFTALNRVEILIAIIIVASLFYSYRYDSTIYIFYVLPILLLLIQTIWLLPILNLRVDKILSGQSISSTYHHTLFIVLEVLKIIGLIIAGVRFIKFTLST